MGEKITKEAAISWWLVLGGGSRVTLLHFMVVLHLQVPAVSEIAWAGAVCYQFCSQQAPQVKHFIAGVGLCALLDSLKWKVRRGKKVMYSQRKQKQDREWQEAGGVLNSNGISEHSAL